MTETQFNPTTATLQDIQRRYRVDWSNACQIQNDVSALLAQPPAQGLPDIEVVSAKVHEAWMHQKRATGVTTRKSESGEELLVPYSQLSEPAKELDRATVRAVYAAIRAALPTQDKEK